MKKFGIVLALSFVAVCALVVVGCGGETVTSPQTVPSDDTITVPPAPTPEPAAPAPEPAADPAAPAPADPAAPAPADPAAPAPADPAAPAADPAAPAADQAASGAALTDEFDDFDYSAGGGAASKKR